MWFVISILANQPTLKIFRIFPIPENKADTWKGFGIAGPGKTEQAYSSKIQFTPELKKKVTPEWNSDLKS